MLLEPAFRLRRIQKHIAAPDDREHRRARIAECPIGEDRQLTILGRKWRWISATKSMKARTEGVGFSGALPRIRSVSLRLPHPPNIREICVAKKIPAFCRGRKSRRNPAARKIVRETNSRLAGMLRAK